LSSQKYCVLGHKYLASSKIFRSGIISVEPDWGLKTHPGCWQSILGGVCDLKNIMFWGINIPPPVIDSEAELSVLNWIVLDGFETKLLSLKLTLDAAN
jgi:hypothetical protein